MSGAFSFITRPAVSPQTYAAVSMRNKIYTNNYAASGGESMNIFVGALATFNPSQTRDVQEVRGMGMGDRILELVPNFHGPFTVSVSRTLFYLSCLFEAFGYKAGISGLVRALHHHKHPLNVRQELILSEPASESFKSLTDVTKLISTATSLAALGDLVAKAVVTEYIGGWFTSYSTNFTSDTSLVTEDGELSFPDVNDGSSVISNIFQDTGNKPGTLSAIASGAASLIQGGTGGAITV